MAADEEWLMYVPGRDLVQGVDVSRWQGDIRWDAFNLDYAIVKASGGDGGLYTDPEFHDNARWPRPWGAYHFAGGKDAKAEASYFANLICGTGWVLPPVLDWEVTSQMGWGPGRAAEAERWIHTFCEGIENALNVRPMIYTGAYVTGIQGGPQSLTRYDLWLAAYLAQPIACGPWGNDWTAWQYTSTGTVPGIQGNVDMNVADRAWFNAAVGGVVEDQARNALTHTEDGMPKQFKFPDGTTYVLVAAQDRPHGFGWQWVDGPQTESDLFYAGSISREVQPLAQEGTQDYDAAFGRFQVLNGPHAGRA